MLEGFFVRLFLITQGWKCDWKVSGLMYWKNKRLVELVCGAVVEDRLIQDQVGITPWAHPTHRDATSVGKWCHS